MRKRIYLRMAKSPRSPEGVKIAASMRANPHPLRVGEDEALHTVSFAVDVEIPDDLFNPKEWPTVPLEVGPETSTKIRMEAVEREE